MQTTAHDNRYLTMALHANHRKLALRLSLMDADDRLYDNELQRLDSRKPQTAFAVMALADNLYRAREEGNS